MNISKFNLYNVEWLDLVFSQRNKAYGAYELRQHYSKTMSKAMGITFAGLAVLVTVSIALRHKPVPADNTRIIEASLNTLIQPPAKDEIKKPVLEKPVSPPKTSTPVPTVRFVTPVVTDKDITEEPPAITELNGAIGPKTIKADGNGPVVVDPIDPPGNGSGKGDIVEDQSIHDFRGIEVMPEPEGGAAGWAKFLQKNLRFPPAAQEQGVSGKVFLSFVVEKNGQISNIKVSRGAGFGFDEEAIRVLKLAKPWKPGIQNGQPVRVAYSIPFNFQLGDGG
ncbi:energy transducer TonB [Mucilaginibacter sp. FT3.2]|uniref:energy transducer TonB n=1 Tax=Mucilaginibacter sp. FT3.2 TaxID=2723090 RepID=UPI0016230AE2|nr:energy transducer TonB [Mucilaginibacter sp. FT3.2]MBB6233889.1 protein TonB [Mucilaginibacter sp. FT3.2]